MNPESTLPVARSLMVMIGSEVENYPPTSTLLRFSSESNRSVFVEGFRTSNNLDIKARLTLMFFCPKNEIFSRLERL